MRLYQIFDHLMNAIVNSSEPKITEKHDRFGNTHYQVYDPANQTSSTMSSEAEVRAWLDQRHNW